MVVYFCFFVFPYDGALTLFTFFSGLHALLLLVALLGISGKMGFVSPTVRAPII